MSRRYDRTWVLCNTLPLGRPRHLCGFCESMFFWMFTFPNFELGFNKSKTNQIRIWEISKKFIWAINWWICPEDPVHWSSFAKEPPPVLCDPSPSCGVKGVLAVWIVCHIGHNEKAFYQCGLICVFPNVFLFWKFGGTGCRHIFCTYVSSNETSDWNTCHTGHT